MRKLISRNSIFFITPVLGLLRNFIKYKKLSFLLFMRTPIINFIIFNILTKYSKIKKNELIYLTIIFERWFMLFIKSIISYINNDHLKKKEKYIVKYSLDYS